MASVRNLTFSIDIRFLKFGVAPLPSAKHLSRQLRLQFRANWFVVCALCHLVRLHRDDIDELTFLELVNHLFIMCFYRRVRNEDLELRLVLILKLFGDSHDFFFLFTCDLDPLVFHCLCEANLCNLGANSSLNVTFKDLVTKF